MYIVGYPESQTHWLAYLLAYCLNTEYYDLDSPNNLPNDEDVKSYLQGNLTHPSYQAQLGKIIRTNALNISQQDQTAIVYMVRDGRDVMLSSYYRQQSFMGKANPHVSQKTFISKAYRKLGLKKLSTQLELSPFSQFLQNHVSEWVSHVNTWLAHQPSVIIRYEDLLTIPEETLASLMMRLGIEVSPEIIQEGLGIFNRKYLSEHRLIKSKKKDIGNPGDWEKYFSKQETIYFQQIAGQVLCTLGYESEI
ncbi:sulfotransferase domain-containing protein [Crocosphaera sp.]|uniref:sulfotransferase domain-containing protein n=1 Tax=Crocosphaera sp. TaxID=2729996 RepID=UPI003F26C168|nr:sulfotransferase domain-containing protein [Crocosphaera sp.]